MLEANAPTYLDELSDETALSIDGAAQTGTGVALLMTHGTESPALFPAVIGELSLLVPAARVEVIDGAGHLPHGTSPTGGQRSWWRTTRAFERSTHRPPDPSGGPNQVSTLVGRRLAGLDHG